MCSFLSEVPLTKPAKISIRIVSGELHWELQ